MTVAPSPASEEESVEIQPLLALPAPSDVQYQTVSSTPSSNTSIYQGISSYSYKNYNYEPKSTTGYVGLSNQGFSCLNSQTLANELIFLY